MGNTTSSPPSKAQPQNHVDYFSNSPSENAISIQKTDLALKNLKVLHRNRNPKYTKKRKREQIEDNEEITPQRKLEKLSPNNDNTFNDDDLEIPIYNTESFQINKMARKKLNNNRVYNEVEEYVIVGKKKLACQYVHPHSQSIVLFEPLHSILSLSIIHLLSHSLFG